MPSSEETIRHPRSKSRFNENVSAAYSHHWYVKDMGEWSRENILAYYPGPYNWAEIARIRAMLLSLLTNGEI